MQISKSTTLWLSWAQVKIFVWQGTGNTKECSSVHWQDKSSKCDCLSEGIHCSLFISFHKCRYRLFRCLAYLVDLWSFCRNLHGAFSCPMDLTNYPFDTQMCLLKIESFGRTMDTLNVNWMDSAVEVDPQVKWVGITYQTVLSPKFFFQLILHNICLRKGFPFKTCSQIRFSMKRGNVVCSVLTFTMTAIKTTPPAPSPTFKSGLFWRWHKTCIYMQVRWTNLHTK